MLHRFLVISALVLCNAVPASAGGPAHVAGAGFDPAVKGQPLAWAGGNVQYFTDQGDLSGILNGEKADTLIADVFTRWTKVPGIAITAALAGHLAEDVSGANVIGFPDGTYSIPDDIQPTRSRLRSELFTTLMVKSPTRCWAPELAGWT